MYEIIVSSLNLTETVFIRKFRPKRFHKIGPRKDFVDTLASSYAAQVLPLPEVEGHKSVNAWVKQATNGKIEKIVGKNLWRVLSTGNPMGIL
jgi:hypothetical protein